MTVFKSRELFSPLVGGLDFSLFLSTPSFDFYVSYLSLV